MSRIPLRNGAIPRRQSDEDDFCPVCKSSRYLNPELRFLVNPECYHKMCTSCVDRIFSSGPAPCPVAGCARTLRKQRFRKQTFDDIQIEREVDIRRRLSQIFNRRQSEFTSLLAYNDYLEEVERLNFNLLHNVDVPATEAAVNSYAAQNASSISHNATLIGQESASIQHELAAQKEAVRLRRMAAIEEENEERRVREEGRREILEKLATSTGDPDVIIKEGQKVVLKKSTARRTAAEKARQAKNHDHFTALGANGSAESGFMIRGLKPVLEPEPEKPYDPFGGMSLRRDYYALQEHYDHRWLDNARTDQAIRAGGYDLKEYYARTMFEAFAGLGCFVGDEISARDTLGSDGALATAKATAAAVGGD